MNRLSLQLPESPKTVAGQELVEKGENIKAILEKVQECSNSRQSVLLGERPKSLV